MPTVSEIRLAGKDRYTSVFESYVETNKTVQQAGRLLTVETAKELKRLRDESPRATGLLAKSWKGYTLAKQDREPPPKELKLPKKPPEKINLDDVYPDWFDEYYASDYRHKKLDRAIGMISVLLLLALAIPLAPIALLYFFYKRFPVVKELPRKFFMRLCNRVSTVKKRLVNTPNRIRLYIRISNTAPNSYYRIVGRAAGKMPPVKKLAAWAKRKGLPESAGYAVAKLIAKQGTARYRSGQNVVGIDPTSQTYRGDAGFVRLVSRVLAHL